MITRGGRLELLLWSLLPGLLTVMLALVTLTFNHAPGLAQFMPLLPLIPVFYWGLEEAGMPYWFAFLLGLVMDAVMGLPLGFSSLLNVFFLALLDVQRKYIQKEGFIVKWAYFAVLLAVVDAVGWIVLSLFHAASFGLMPVCVQWMLTVSSYPPLHLGFDFLQERMQARRWQILHGL